MLAQAYRRRSWKWRPSSLARRQAVRQGVVDVLQRTSLAVEHRVHGHAVLALDTPALLALPL